MGPSSSKDVELDFSKNYDDHLAKYLGIGMKSPCGVKKGDTQSWPTLTGSCASRHNIPERTNNTAGALVINGRN